MMCQRCKRPMVANHSVDLEHTQGHIWRRVANCQGCGTVQGASRCRQLLFRSLSPDRAESTGPTARK